MKLREGLAYLTGEEMAEVDRLSLEVGGITAETLMENAGERVAELARVFVGGDARAKKVSVLVGKGNNGGDGLVAARHLHNWGADVSVILAEGPEKLRDQAARQFAIIRRTGVKVLREARELRAELAIDALLGYSAKGDPREPLASLIRTVNSSGVSILAVDTPSGLDVTTGLPGDPSVSATATVTLGFPKSGFLNPKARRHLGVLYVADISLPRSIYERYRSPYIFSKERIVRAW